MKNEYLEHDEFDKIIHITYEYTCRFGIPVDLLYTSFLARKENIWEEDRLVLDKNG